MLEITKAERSHELLLTTKNQRDLGGSPFPYIIPIIPHSLPAKAIKGENFVLVDLFKLVPGSSSQAVSAQEGQAKAAKGTLVKSACVTPPQSPRPTPSRQKKRKETRARKTKTATTRLEDFVDWTGVVANEPAGEEEMSSLVIEFSAQMRKRATGLESEATSSSGGKRSRRSSPDEKAQKNWAIISMDSPDRASSDQSAL